MPRYRIFPSIGIARLGADERFFLGAESPGGAPQELLPDGSLAPVTQFKNTGKDQIRKQGARFHLFESNDGTTWSAANLPAGTTVTWTVRLVNKKSAVQRPDDPPIEHMRPVVPAGHEDLVIDGGSQSISGASISSAPLVGTYKTSADNGTPFQVNVELGRLHTDAAGRLIVVGGKGMSSAPPGTPLGHSYYVNPKWHDDVSDGPVSAEIRLPAGAAPITAEGGAWVVVTPPDYAPEIACPVTLFDVIRQIGIDRGDLSAPGRPSFDLDIAPLLTRVRRLRWVHDDASWSDVRLSDPKLRSRAPADQLLREKVRDDLVLRVEQVLKGHTDGAGPPFRFRQAQRDALDRWVAGDFDDAPAPPTAGPSADGLTRAALEGAAGQGFCPGIEAGIIVTDPQVYEQPFDFRISHAVLQAGDLTALMAQPWQADFVKCRDEWWPTQRPDLAFQTANDHEDWIRGSLGHLLLVQRSARLGFIVRQGADEVFLESERDPTL